MSTKPAADHGAEPAPATVATGDLTARLADVEARLGRLERTVAQLIGATHDEAGNQTDDPR